MKTFIDKRDKLALQDLAQLQINEEQQKLRQDLRDVAAGSVWDQLDYLRGFTRQTGMLHEAQVFQLKVWPRVFFQRSVSSTVAIDISEKKMVFTIHESPAPPSARKDEAIYDRKAAPGTLDASVKRMLGNDWDVSVVVIRGASTLRYHFGPESGVPERVSVRVERKRKAGKGRKPVNGRRSH